MKKLLRLGGMLLFLGWLYLPTLLPGTFQGSDSQAQKSIAQDRPSYIPWARNWWSPKSAEIESGLFALQAGVAGMVLGYVLGRLDRRLA